MKRTCRFMGAFLCLFIFCALVFPVHTFAADSAWIDTADAHEGYFTVCYTADVPVKMKVGVTCGSSTKYYSYTHGEEASYVFTEGNGNYAITLYRNVRGTSYAVVDSETVTVNMNSEFAPYLASTAEITFSKDDAVGKKAADLCNGSKKDSEKVVSIHNYISQNFVYDYAFAEQVRSGAVTNYTPETESILKNQKGICYDFSSLFAAMCRSQNIPCQIQKGYLNGKYHAWNLVYVDGAWQSVDMTVSISKDTDAASFKECLAYTGTGSNYRF